MENEEKWIELVKAVCILAGDWMGYENSPDPDVIEKYNKTMRSTAIALRQKAKDLISSQEYIQGKIDGITEYAWWKDGTQYVGSGSITLKEALKDL